MARRVRILIYDGPEPWLDATLADPRRYVKGKRVVGDDRSISEIIVPEGSTDAFINELPGVTHGS